MIPLLVLGIPALPATAILLSAMMIHGIQPGPRLMIEHPDVFWGVIASLYLANIILLLLNLPLVGLFVNLLRIPYGYLAPLVLLLCIVGVYSISSSGFDLGTMAVFGVIGYFLRKLEFDVAPMLLAVVLGGRMEASMRQALMISNGDYRIFLEGAVSHVLLGAIALLFVLLLTARILGVRRADTAKAEQE